MSLVCAWVLMIAGASTPPVVYHPDRDATADLSSAPSLPREQVSALKRSEASSNQFPFHAGGSLSKRSGAIRREVALRASQA